MDQVKSGSFISELRREKDLTQSELADIIGVSAKTVSKWETGRGMPEISTLPVLCETLGISVNELLSGERVSAESYTERAEENMVTLLKESSTYDNRKSVIAVAAPVIAVIALTLMIISSWSWGNYMWFVDIPSILFIFAITTVFLIAAGSYGDLWRSFGYAAGFGVPDRQRLLRAVNAVKLAGGTLLSSSALLAGISAVNALMLSPDEEILLLAGAMVPVELLYGIVGWLMSLPIRARLEKRVIRLG